MFSRKWRRSESASWLAKAEASKPKKVTLPRLKFMEGE